MNTFEHVERKHGPGFLEYKIIINFTRGTWFRFSDQYTVPRYRVLDVFM